MNSTIGMHMNSTLVMNTTINTSTNKSNLNRRHGQAKKKKSRNRKLQLTAVIRECYQRSSSSSSSSYETDDNTPSVLPLSLDAVDIDDDTESLRLLPKQNLMPSLSLFSVPTLSQVKYTCQSHSKTINEEDNTSNTTVSPPPSPPPLAPLFELQRNRSDSPNSAMQTCLFDRQEEEEDAQEFFDQDLFRSTVTLPNPFKSSQSKTIHEGGNTSHAVSPPPVPPPPLALLELKRNLSDSPTSVMQTFLFDHQEEEVEEDAHALFDKNLFKSTVMLPNLFDDDTDYDNTTADDEYYEDHYYYADDHFQEETMNSAPAPTPTTDDDMSSMVGVVDPSMVATILHNANSYVLDTTDEIFEDDIIVDDDVIVDAEDEDDDDDDDDDEIEIEPLPVFTARDAESIVQDMILDDELSVPHYLVPTPPTTMHPPNNTPIHKGTIPNWLCHYQEVKKFQEMYGHCDIPSTSTSFSTSSYYQQLALWKKRQQFDYYQKEHHLPGGSAMTLDRIMALEKIPGWSWW